MMTWGRLLFGLTFLTAGLAGVSSAQPQWLGSLGVGEVGRWIAREEQREEKLAWRGEIINRRMAAKRKIVRQLLEGQITLFQAAALFGYLNDTPEDCRDHYRLMLPGSSDGEKLCRQVISWTKQDVGPIYSPEHVSLPEQLEAQLQEHIAANGGVVVLPEE